MTDILPDCRTKNRTGSIRSTIGTLIPVYCANCGVPYGMVPEKMITFAFVLCQPCADAGHGDLAHLYQEPDAVFFEKVRIAQLEEYGHPLNQNELAIQLDNPSSTMSMLAKDWRTYVSKGER